MSARDVLTVMVRTDRGDMTVWSPQQAREAIDAYRSAVLREAAGFVRDAHFAEGMSVQEIGTALGHMADAARLADQEPGTPTPLRWGLDDAELADDDSVTLWLSGPSGEPYALELEPERAAALRGVLAERSGGDCCCEPERDHDDLTLPTAYLHQVGCPVAEREEREAGRG